MEGGIDDVGIGVLFGLNTYRYDFIGLLMHAEHWEAKFGVGPVSYTHLDVYKRQGEAPLVKNFKRNAYGRVADTLGIERYQSVPHYLLTDTLVPERYGQDGELTRFIEDGEKFIKAEPILSLIHISFLVTTCIHTAKLFVALDLIV